MTNRQKFINYVKYGGKEFICSPQIGAGAGFDAKISGKTWYSDATYLDTKAVCQKFDMVPLINLGLPDISDISPDMKRINKPVRTNENGRRFYESELVTPKGTLNSISIEDELKGGCPIKYFVTQESELDVLDYFLDSLIEVKDFSYVTQKIKEYREAIGEDYAIDIQWSMQPYELFCFTNNMDNAIFALECPEKLRKLMDKILILDEKIIDAVAKGGADFVFLGAPGIEVASPKYYDDFIVPYSKMVTDMVHKSGLMVYAHMCSLVEPMLSMGCYNKMGIDLFETLSEPPVGNIKSIEDAFSKIDPEICTRGNIGLDALLKETPEQIKERSFKIMETAEKMGRKHILAASDYLFYETPEENVHAMCEAVREFNDR